MLNTTGQTPTPIRFGSIPVNRTNIAQLKDAVKNKQVMFVDVDTQRGFMWPMFLWGGKGTKFTRRVGLTVPGTETILKALKKMTDLAVQFKIPLIQTMDTHEENDPEFELFTAISDEHCIRGAVDWQKIPETIVDQKQPWHVQCSPEVDDVPSLADLKQLFAEGHPLVIEKNSNSVFDYRQGPDPDDWGQPNQKAFDVVDKLKQMGLKFAFVYGVATEYCVKKAVEGLKPLGIIPIVVSDAVKEFEVDALADPKDPVLHDVLTITTKQLQRLLKSASK